MALKMSRYRLNCQLPNKPDKAPSPRTKPKFINEYFAVNGITNERYMRQQPPMQCVHVTRHTCLSKSNKWYAQIARSLVCHALVIFTKEAFNEFCKRWIGFHALIQFLNKLTFGVCVCVSWHVFREWPNGSAQNLQLSPVALIHRYKWKKDVLCALADRWLFAADQHLRLINDESHECLRIKI